MAKAYKCDVCGTYHDEGTKKFLKTYKDKSGGRLIGSKEYELCPDCMNKIYSFLEVDENEEV